MCAQINNTLEQANVEQMMPYYPAVYPHGLDYMTGGYIYGDSIPQWWYRLSEQLPPAILDLGPCHEMMPMEAELVLLACIDRPAAYTMVSRATWHLASNHWWQVVQDLHLQTFTPYRRINWWGWNLQTQGPPPSPARVFDPTYVAEVDYETYGDMARRSVAPFYEEDEFEVETQDLLQVSLPTEVNTMRELGYESDEWVFWRAAQLALEAGIRDAEELGWPHPIAIRGSPAGFRLIFDEEAGLSDTTLSQIGSESPY